MWANTGELKSMASSTKLRAHDFHDDWGLVMAGNGYLEITKDGTNFESIPFPGIKLKICVSPKLQFDPLLHSIAYHNLDNILQRQIPTFMTGHGVGEDALPFLIRMRSLQPDYHNNPLKTASKPPRAKAEAAVQIQLRYTMKENQKSADKLRSTQEAKTHGLLARP